MPNMHCKLALFHVVATHDDPCHLLLQKQGTNLSTNIFLHTILMPCFLVPISMSHDALHIATQHCDINNNKNNQIVLHLNAASEHAAEGLMQLATCNIFALMTPMADILGVGICTTAVEGMTSSSRKLSPRPVHKPWCMLQEENFSEALSNVSKVWAPPGICKPCRTLAVTTCCIQ